MAVYQANVISCEVDVNVSKRDGGSYKGALLTYRSNGQLQEKGIHESVYTKIRPFLKAKLNAIKAGDVKFLHMEKPDGKQFWELMDITDSNDAPAANTSSGGTTGASTGATKGKSRYDNDSDNLPINVTSQRSYARNQALTAAIAFTASNTVNDTDNVIATARVFEAYITGDSDKEAADAGIPE